MDAARSFLSELHEEVADHPGVGHSLLGRMTTDPRAREDFRIFAGQHFPLVANFCRYMELLLLRAPNSGAKVWIAKVLVDEYGERSDGLDHVAHYRRFMNACGWPDSGIARIPLHPAVCGFVREHLRICREEPFLVGLGAVGPGHEWAIPTMFEHCIAGLHRAGLGDDEIGYFTLHTVQDVDHGAWLEEALADLAGDDAAREQIRRGCLLSLAAREQFWWGVAEKINAARAADHLPGAASAAGGEGPELTCDELMDAIRVDVTLPPTRRQG